MYKVGIFSSIYSGMTFFLLDEVSGNLSIIPINIQADKYNGEALDILIINQKPVSFEPFAFSCNAAVVNTDDTLILKYLTKLNTQVITYGFNSKASVTASSIHDDRVVFCIQRALQTLNGDCICQQEFSINTGEFLKYAEAFYIDYSQLITNCLLPAVTAALVAGAPIELMLNVCGKAI